MTASSRWNGSYGRLGWVLAVLASIAMACSGSEGEGEAGDDTPTAANGVPVALEFLGDLVAMASGPVSTTFDSSAGSLALDDATIVDVAAGSFSAPTEVTAVAVDLVLDQYVENAPWGRAYVLSTEEDIELNAPVVLEISRPSASVRVTQLIDGEWRVVDVPTGPTIRVPIVHFSEVPTVVVDSPEAEPVPIGAEPEGDAPAAFLTACLFAVGGPTLDANELSTALAFSVCTRALINTFTPAGEHVSVSCVGDKVTDDTSFQQAIDACVAENATAPDAAESTEDPGPVDTGPLSWNADLTLDSQSMTQHGDAVIGITRVDGTDEFNTLISVATTSVTDFFGIGECTTIIAKTFDGTGTFVPDNPNRIVFSGEQVIDWQYPDCAGITENDSTKDFQVSVRVTEDGLEGGFEGFLFSVPGVPIPIGNS